MTVQNLSTLSVDPSYILAQLQVQLQSQTSWKDLLTSGVGETITEFIASVGSFDQYTMRQIFLNLFNDSTRLDSAIYANTKQAGVRLRRKIPASVSVTVQNTTSAQIALVAYSSQFSLLGHSLFLRNNLTVMPGAYATFNLYEGILNGSSPYFNSSQYYTGTGNDFQSIITSENSFSLSDTDVLVWVNGTTIPVQQNGLWNYKNSSACQDITTRDGRLQVLFGNSGPSGATGINSAYGYVPAANSSIQLLYVTTQGSLGNDVTVGSASPNQLTGLPVGLTCTSINSALTGGLDEISAAVYKTVGPSLFATSERCVTQDDYNAMATTYTGTSALSGIGLQNNIQIADAFFQPQQDINSDNLTFMNFARVWLLHTDNTQNPISLSNFPAVWNDFISWLSSRAMFSMRYGYNSSLPGNLPTSPSQAITKPYAYPYPIVINIAANVGCYNYANLNAIQAAAVANLVAYFSPRSGIINHDIYLGDITKIIQQTDQAIDYVQMITPLSDCMINISNINLVSAVVSAASSLPASFITYAITAIYKYDGATSTESAPQYSVINILAGSGVRLTWGNMQGCVSYNIYRQSSSISSGAWELISNIPSTSGQLSFTDIGVSGSAATPPAPTASGGDIDASGVRYPVCTSVNITLNMVYTQRQFV